jgi:hypothetical protein
MRSAKTILWLVWSLALLLFIFLSFYLHQSSRNFYGTTKPSMTSLNHPWPVRILDIKRHEGEHIEAGMVLYSYKRIDLDDKVEKLKEEMERIISDHRIFREKIAASIRLTKIEEAQTLLPVTQKIEALRVQKKERLSFLTTLDPKLKPDTTKITAKLRTLQKERKLIKERFSKKRDALKKEQEIREKEVVPKLDRLYKKRQALLDARKPKEVIATKNAIVQKIAKREGMTLQPFEDIMLLTSSYPTTVEAFIPETESNMLNIREKVVVKTESKQGNTKSYIAEVIDMGSRIEQIPPHLKKFQNIALWGYKIVLKLPPNDLKIDQKVALSTQKQDIKPVATLFKEMVGKVKRWVGL